MIAWTVSTVRTEAAIDHLMLLSAKATSAEQSSLLFTVGVSHVAFI